MVESGCELQDVLSARAAEAARLVRLFILAPVILILLPPLTELMLLLGAIVTLESNAAQLADMAVVGASPSAVKRRLQRCGWA